MLTLLSPYEILSLIQKHSIPLYMPLQTRMVENANLSQINVIVIIVVMSLRTIPIIITWKVQGASGHPRLIDFDFSRK